MRLFDKEAAGRFDSTAVKKYGISILQLMENAGAGVARLVLGELKALSGNRVLVIAGKGANGGDGFVAARHLRSAGADVKVVCTEPVLSLSMKAEAGVNSAIWSKTGGSTVTIRSQGDIKRHLADFEMSDVIVDALFGTGLSSDVKGVHAGIIEAVNRSKARVVSVDIPSGIDATTGKVLATAVRADVTATMAAPKLGLYLYPGRTHAGRVEVVDIGLSPDVVGDGPFTGGALRHELITDRLVSTVIRPRQPDAHKGTFGHLLVIAGSQGMTGAAYMSGTSAMRAGAGLVTIALPASLNPVMEAKTTEVMTLPLPEISGGTLGMVSLEALKDGLNGKSALLIGPGLGSSGELEGLLARMIKDIDLPLLIDASGLDAIGPGMHLLKRSKAPVVLTPHPGEAGRLLGISSAEVQKDRVKAALSIARASGAVVVLKGAGTVIADKYGNVFISATGNPALATAGTGDVLSGIIGGLLAQGYGPLEAAFCGAHIHGSSADGIKASGIEAGMMATDLMPVIPRVLAHLTSGSVR